LFIAIWSLLLLGVRLTWAQAFSILVSLCGVLTILLRGDIGALSKITLNKGDIMFLVALAIFGFYSALSVKRPAIHSLSFLAFTFGFGALCLIPAFALELATRPMAQFTVQNVAVLAYVAVFPSILSYLCFNRGIELIGANRAAPFFHLIPVFGSAMAIVFLGEKLRLFHLAGYALVLAGVVIAARRLWQIQSSENLPVSLTKRDKKRPATHKNQNERTDGPERCACVVSPCGEIGRKMQQPRNDITIQQPSGERYRRLGQDERNPAPERKAGSQDRSAEFAGCDPHIHWVPIVRRLDWD
jgi:uncharacterized membrane protein